MAIPSRFLDELRERIGLADVVGRRTRLTKKGKEHSGLCPFHKEKTPSFTVNEDKGFYHCFGCGAHGSAFDFLMETEGLNFREAVEKLAAEVLQVAEDALEDIKSCMGEASVRDLLNIFNSAVKTHRDLMSDIVAIEDKQSEAEDKLAQQYTGKVDELLKKITGENGK